MNRRPLAILGAAGALLLGAQADLSPLLACSRPHSRGWTRHGKNPVLAGEQFLANPAVLHEGTKYRMWLDVGDGMSLLESEDGIAWKKKAARILDEAGARAPSVVQDPTLRRGHPRKYRLYYSRADGIGLAFSKDGKKFTALPAAESPHEAPALVLAPNAADESWDSPSISDPHVLHHDGKWHLWYGSDARDAEPARRWGGIAYATSADGIRWEKHGVVLRPEIDWEHQAKESRIGRPQVLWAHDMFEMFYDASVADDNAAQTTSAGMGFASSTDGKTWARDIAPVFTGNYGPGESKGLIVGTGILVKPDGYYFYYPGTDSDWTRPVINLAVKR